MSAFAEPLAQVRQALNKPWCPNLGSCMPEMHSGCSYCADHEDAVAALDRVERLATEMETTVGREILAKFQEAEGIDRQHGFTLPGDSALYIALWGLENALSAREEGADTR